MNHQGWRWDESCEEIFKVLRDVMDAAKEQYDDITEIAATLCDCPISLICFLNPNAEAFYKSCYGMDSEDLSKLDCLLQHTLNAEKVLVIEEHDFLKGNKNTEKFGFYAATPLITPRGNKIGTLSVIDYKPRKLSENQNSSLVKLGKQVVKLLELGTLLVDLSVKNEKLEKLSEQKTHILGVVSHDIRQPLNNIMVCSELLLSDPEYVLPNIVKDIVQASYTNAQYMHSLVDEILQSAQYGAETASVKLNTKPVNLVKLVESIILKNAPLAKRKDIILQFNRMTKKRRKGTDFCVAVSSTDNINPNQLKRNNLSLNSMEILKEQVITCEVDCLKLEQVVNNLIGNAIKYSHPHSVVAITVGKEDSQKAFISVQDNGVGMSKDDINNLFKPFVRASSLPTMGESSTGLGLSIANNIVKAHGGKIKVESEVGIGTTFTAIIPTTKLSNVPEQDALIKFENGELTGDGNKVPSYRVLMVDDNSVSRLVIEKILEKRGHKVYSMSNCEEALIEIQNSHNWYHMFIVDENMPDMCGSQLIKYVREFEKKEGLPRIPIISISGHIEDEYRAKISEAGADLFISKPFRAATLVEIVESKARR